MDRPTSLLKNPAFFITAGTLLVIVLTIASYFLIGGMFG